MVTGKESGERSWMNGRAKENGRSDVKRYRKGGSALKNQYALCFGMQLKGRESLLSIFFDQQLLESFPPSRDTDRGITGSNSPAMMVQQDSSAWRVLQERTNAATICTYGSFHAFIKNWTLLSKAASVPSPLFPLLFHPSPTPAPSSCSQLVSTPSLYSFHPSAGLLCLPFFCHISLA